MALQEILPNDSLANMITGPDGIQGPAGIPKTLSFDQSDEDGIVVTDNTTVAEPDKYVFNVKAKAPGFWVNISASGYGSSPSGVSGAQLPRARHIREYRRAEDGKLMVLVQLEGLLGVNLDGLSAEEERHVGTLNASYRPETTKYIIVPLYAATYSAITIRIFTDGKIYAIADSTVPAAKNGIRAISFDSIQFEAVK